MRLPQHSKKYPSVGDVLFKKGISIKENKRGERFLFGLRLKYNGEIRGMD
jgi:hypothetical protein